MIKLLNILKEITVNKPSSNILKNNLAKSAYDFFKNDQDIFKDSGIEKEILRHSSYILSMVWDKYNEIYREYEEEDEELNLPSDQQDLFNSDKETGGTEDSWYFELNEFLLEYIAEHLKKTGWNYLEDTEFEKDGYVLDIFDYLHDITEYDTSPRENLYEKFITYFGDFFK